MPTTSTIRHIADEEPICSNVAPPATPPTIPQKQKAPAAHSHRGPTTNNASTHRLTIFAGTLIASTPPTTINAASIYIPESLAAVACFNQPTAYGLKKPASLPIELIIAIPAAAPVPARIAGGGRRGGGGGGGRPI